MTLHSLKRRAACGDDGFTLIELIVATLVLMIVSGAVLKGVMDMSALHNTVMNRTDLHAGVRNATQLLSQEVGQAGRISLPAAVTLTAATAIGATLATVSSATDMFVGEQLLIDAGTNSETVTVTAIAGNVLTTIGDGERAYCRRSGHRDRRIRSRRGPGRHGQRLIGDQAEDLRRHQRQRQHGLRRVPGATPPTDASIATQCRSRPGPSRHTPSTWC